MTDRNDLQQPVLEPVILEDAAMPDRLDVGVVDIQLADVRTEANRFLSGRDSNTESFRRAAA